MASKLVYLIMDWVTFNNFSVLEPVRSEIRALETSIGNVKKEINYPLVKANYISYAILKNICSENPMLSAYSSEQL